MNVISPKKLIEVALPLDAINIASATGEVDPPGTPVHAAPLVGAPAAGGGAGGHLRSTRQRPRRPVALSEPRPRTEPASAWSLDEGPRELFKIIEDLVLWENTTNETVLKPAREAIRQSWRETCELNKGHPQAKELFNPDKMPGLHDPFAGGGTIPLEAQRLGLEAFASDLNPVAVLINKAMIEIPPKFADKPPVHPDAQNALATLERRGRAGRRRAPLRGLDAG